MFTSNPEKRFAAKANWLGLKTPQLPGKAVCMDGERYQPNPIWLSTRYPKADEEPRTRLTYMGKMFGLNHLLEFIDGEGKYWVARDTKYNRAALVAAGFKYSDKMSSALGGSGLKWPIVHNTTLFAPLFDTPQDGNERLCWAVRDANVEEFRYALRHGADISQIKKPLIFDAFKIDGQKDLLVRDEMIRRLLSGECTLENEHKDTPLHAAMASHSPTHTVIPDILKAGVDPFQRNKYGLPAFLKLSHMKVNDDGAAQLDFKLVTDAMLKTPGVANKERQMIQAQSRIINAVMDPDTDKSWRYKNKDVIAALHDSWKFAHDLSPDDRGKVPPQLITLLEPLLDAAGAPNPLEAKRANHLLKILMHCNVGALNNSTNDMVRQFTSHVVLPQALLEYARDTNQTLNDEFLHTLDNQKLMDALIPIVKMKLFEGRSIDKWIGLNIAWHDPLVVFPDSMKPLLIVNREWHCLTQQKEYEVPELPGVTIHVLTTSDEVKQEAEDMDNCLVKGNYATKCLNGAAHLFSVRKAGEKTPLSTIEATWDGRNYTVIQNRSQKNGDAPEEALAAEQWLKNQLESGKIKANSQKGETEESKARHNCPAVLMAIGFELTQENVNAAFAEYTQNPKRRAREYNPETGNFDTISRRTELIAGTYNTTITGENGQIEHKGISF